MRKFLKKITLFLTFLLIYYLGNIIINLLIIQYQEFEIKSNVIIAGDSHTRRNLNPSLLTQADNISQSAENYAITYWKLIEISKESRIDTLILGFAPHNLSSFNNNKLKDNALSYEMFSRIYPIFNPFLETSLPINHFEYVKVLWREMAIYPKFSHLGFIGEYSNSNKSDLNYINNTVKRHFYEPNGQNAEISLEMKNYLDSIIDFSIKQKIELFLVSTPVHKNYYKEIPGKHLNHFNKLKKELKSKPIKIYDFQINDYPDSLFLDGDHLNNFGSEIFTKKFRKIISK